MILSYLLEHGMNWDFHSAGIYPRRLENIWGIFTIIFVHSDLEHLSNNVVSFLLLGSSLFFFYRQIAIKILINSYIFSGIILWIIGRENWHIGASGLIYSLAFFLFFSGVFRRNTSLIAISLTIAFLYGSMIWHLFPWQLQDPISWEGHLAGGIVGLVLSFLYRKQGPQKEIVEWDENNEDNEVAEDKEDIEGNEVAEDKEENEEKVDETQKV